MAETSAKELLLTMPVLGTALAVTFDVGYLSGIDINYFTLFSISEHITFAIEALPFAMTFATFVALIPLLRDYVRVRRAQRGAKKQTPRPFYRSRLFWPLLAVFGVSAWQVWQTPHSSLAWLTCGMALVILFAEICATAGALGLAGLVITSAVLGLYLSFITGITLGAYWRKSDKFAYTIKLDDSQLQARIVRSGEKGLLFFQSPDNTLRFVPWTEIKGLASSPSLPPSGVR